MSKKTENIEIRVSPELKEAISRLSKSRGQSMSEAIRDLLAREVAAPSTEKRGAFVMPRLPFPIPLKTTLAAMSVGVLAMAYTLSAQHPASAYSEAELRMLFAEYDRNDDNIVTPEEFAAIIAVEEAEEEAERAEEADDLDAPFPTACAGTFLEEEYLEEIAAPEARDIDQEFAELDSNGNKELEFAEFQAMRVAERARLFIEHDHDGNGFVTLAELTEDLMPAALDELRADLTEEGIPAPCVEIILAAETKERAEEDEDPVLEARLIIAEHDLDRDGRVGLMEFINR